MIRHPDGRVEGTPEELARYVRELGMAPTPNWPVLPFRPRVPHPRRDPYHHYPTYTCAPIGARRLGVAEGMAPSHAVVN